MRSAAEGISQETIRELKLLQELGHPHIIRVFQVFGHRGNINVVLEQMSTDLEVIINTTSIVLRPGDIKAYMRVRNRSWPSFPLGAIVLIQCRCCCPPSCTATGTGRCIAI